MLCGIEDAGEGNRPSALELLATLDLWLRGECDLRYWRWGSERGRHLQGESPAPAPFPPADEFPVVCKKTQCIICMGNERLPYIDRTRAFNRVSHMWDHVEDVHLRHVSSEQRIICHHPVCKAEGVVLNNVMHFKNHVARVHEIDLRPKVFPY
jgi:hypothetical protein